MHFKNIETIIAKWRLEQARVVAGGDELEDNCSGPWKRQVGVELERSRYICETIRKQKSMGFGDQLDMEGEGQASLEFQAYAGWMWSHH